MRSGPTCRSRALSRISWKKEVGFVEFVIIGIIGIFGKAGW
jgi:hypothetical protein